MAKRQTVRLDPVVYGLRARAVEIEPSIITPGMMDIVHGWWGSRMDRPSQTMASTEHTALAISEPDVEAGDDIKVSRYGWHMVGRLCAFAVAAETAHQITDTANELGYDMYGIAMGDINQSTLIVGSHTASSPHAVDQLMPELVQATNDRLEGGRVPLRLPLRFAMRQAS